MQRHPFKQVVMHLDFLRIDAKHAVQVNAPIHFINEEDAEKSGGTMAHHINEIAITVYLLTFLSSSKLMLLT